MALHPWPVLSMWIVLESRALFRITFTGYTTVRFFKHQLKRAHLQSDDHQLDTVVLCPWSSVWKARGLIGIGMSRQYSNPVCSAQYANWRTSCLIVHMERSVCIWLYDILYLHTRVPHRPVNFVFSFIPRRYIVFLPWEKHHWSYASLEVEHTFTGHTRCELYSPECVPDSRHLFIVCVCCPFHNSKS